VRPTPTPIGSQNAAIDDVPPGAVTIAAHRTGGKITFTWTYDGALASDTFLWRVAGSDKSTASKQPSVGVTDKSGTQTCIQVKVVRADGNGSPDWSPEGCGS
jgi:hypothetical protein